MTTHSYPGRELELFAEARHWKHYLHSQLQPLLKGRVLEVGAGIGGSTAVLCDGVQQQWLCLEPDPQLYQQLTGSVHHSCVEFKNGTIASLDGDVRFDLILYLDVLEHIKDDAGELARAARHLNPGGSLLVVSPAHQYLYTPFDRAIGHYRRYNRKRLGSITPDGMKVVRQRYLDSVGMLASLANRWLLKSPMPDKRQIVLWDKFMVPLSRLIDPLLCYSLGKTLLVQWRRVE